VPKLMAPEQLSLAGWAKTLNADKTAIES